MILALLDGFFLLTLYNLLFAFRFGNAPRLLSLTALSLGVLWIAISYLLGRYSRPGRDQLDSLHRRLFATLLVPLLLLVLCVVGWQWTLSSDDPRTFRSFLLPLLSGTALLSAVLQCGLWTLRHRALRLLIVAAPPEAEVITQELAASPTSDNPHITFCVPEHLERDPGFSQLHKRVDGIAVSDSLRISDSLAEAILSQRGRGTTVCSLLQWAECHFQRVPPELLTSRGILQLEGFDLHPGRWRWRVKRFADLVLGSALLLASLPLLAFLALLIRLEDGGPVFYRQLRTGLYGQPITMWKLRSMHLNAEQHGARWAQRQDPRITRIGRWLRQWRLDELPQLFSVLTGDMSLIGPRPERPEIEQTLIATIPHYRLRHSIRPGLSGWAQVCFPYGASITDSRTKLSYDLYYLRNASLILDILILFKTIRLVLRGHGAIPKA